MVKSREQTEVHIGPQGRVVIPVEIRRILGLEPGTTLIARIEDGRLVLEKPENILARLRSRFAQIPPSVSLANELITERRQAAAPEAVAQDLALPLHKITSRCHNYLAETTDSGCVIYSRGVNHLRDRTSLHPKS